MQQKRLSSILRNFVNNFQKSSQQVMRTLEGPILIKAILFMFYVTCLNNKLLQSIFNQDTNLEIKLYHYNNHLLKGYYCRMMMC